MEQKILKLYKECIRFDEGKLCKTQQYKTLVAEEERLRQMLIDAHGLQIAPLLEEYTAAIYEEMELEAMHYFEQGTRAL